MKRTFVILLFILATLSVNAVCHPAYGQQDDPAARERTRQRLADLLDKTGPALNMTFSQSTKQPFNYIASLRTGLVNAESFEIVISVTAKDTVGFRVYPHYKNGYINPSRINDGASLMRLLLRLSDRAFLFWGIDETGDIFTGYTFTLESGFPEEAIKIVLRSIVNSDKFVGEMRPFLDAPIADVAEIKPAAPATAPAKKLPAVRRRTPTRRRRR